MFHHHGVFIKVTKDWNKNIASDLAICISYMLKHLCGLLKF